MTATGSQILDEGRTPEAWAQALAERGLEVKPRTLRERANRIGACHRIGRQMIITPDQLDQIIDAPASPKRRKAAAPVVSLDAARAHLAKRAAQRKSR